MGTIGGAGTLCVAADDALLKKFLEQAPKRWAEYREHAAHAEGVVRVRTDFTAAGTRRVTKDEESFIIDGFWVRTIRQGDLNRVKRCEATNSQYSFVLYLTENGRWGISWLGPPQLGSAPRETVGGRLRWEKDSVVGDRDLRDNVMKLTCRGMILWITWLPGMVESPDFRVLRIMQVPKSAGLVKVVYTYEPATPEPRDYVRSGTLVLDTTRYWLVREAEYTAACGDARGVIKVVNEFDDTMMPFPVVKRHVEHDSAKTGKWREGEVVLTCEMHKPRHDERQFRLPAFGIPETGEQR